MSSRRQMKRQAVSGAAAGTIAAIPYLGVMAGDIALTGYQSNDVQLLESLARGRPSRVPWIGLLAHLANGAGLGICYSLVQRWLPGPAWLRGICFGVGFTLLIWPLTPVLDRFHPLIRQGRLPPFARLIPLLQNLDRHLIFGLALGTGFRLLQRE